MLRGGLPTHTQVHYLCLFLIAGCDQGPTCPAVLRDLMQHLPFFLLNGSQVLLSYALLYLKLCYKDVRVNQQLNYSEVLPVDADGCCS